MPSDSNRLEVVREALGGLWTGYAEAAAVGADEVEGILRGARSAAREDGRTAFAAKFGKMAAAHIDTDRLATLFADEPALSGPALKAVEAAGAVLCEIADEREPGVLDLPAGESLASAIERALARIGRAFGAAHVVALTRANRFKKKEHEPWLEAYPFHRWTRRERLRVPPLIVTLAGADLRAGGLGEYIDGAQKLVLLVRDNEAPPAPLVRLISPGVYIAQTHDGAQLQPLAAWSGPGVVAWVPETSAAFVHDPAAGPALGARIQILSEPQAPRRGLGGLSAAQLADELRQLEAMSSPAPRSEGQDPESRPESENPADRLAAWILSQANVADAAVETE